MKKITWSKHIEANRAELQLAISAAYREQLGIAETAGNLQRIVLFESGQILTMESSSNGFYAAEHNGRAVCIASIRGQKPDEWDEWLSEFDGDVEKTKDEIMRVAIVEWEFNPDIYINESIALQHDLEQMQREAYGAR